MRQVLAAGECKVQMGPASVPCTDDRISQAMAGGGDGAAIAHDGGECYNSHPIFTSLTLMYTIPMTPFFLTHISHDRVLFLMPTPL